MRFVHRLLGALAFAIACGPSLASAAEDAPIPRGGAVVLDRRDLLAFVADADNAAVQTVNLSSGDVVTTELPCAPEEVLLLGERRLAVSLRGCSKVAILSIGPSGEGRVEWAIDVPAEPWGLALGPGGALLVTSAWGRALTAIDLGTSSIKFSLDLPREPRGVTVSPDGLRAFVTHAVGDAISVVDLAPSGGGESLRARPIKALGGHQRNRIDHAAGAGTIHPTASLAYASAWNERGTRLFVPHLLVQNGRDTARFVGGGYGGVSVLEDTSVASVAVIAARTEEPLVAASDAKADAVAPLHSDFMGTPSIAPEGSPGRQARAAAVLGDSLFVTSFGTGQLVELDARAIDPAMSVVRTFEVGAGPSGLDVDRATGVVVVWSQIAHAISVVSLGSGSVETIPVSEDPLSADMALGRRLFHLEGDRRLARDGRSCAGCHPEGRADGLVWRLGGGERKTLLLAGRLDHGPYGWNGEHADLSENIAETIRRLGGQGLSPEELRSLALYVQKGLTPPPAPQMKPSVAADVQRGKALFESDQVGCVWCHKLSQDASDRSLHDVGSRSKDEDRAAFRTPPLRGLEGSGPYFHDGRYATIEAVLDQNLDRMGNTSSLSPQDRAALAAFLRSL